MKPVKILLSSALIALLTACSSGGDADTKGDSGDDTNITKPVKNLAPTANAGQDLNVQVNNTLHITGSGTDSDGTIVSYVWKQGNTVLATTTSFDYTPSVVGTDTLTLTVTDDKGATASDSMNVMVSSTAVPNNPPSANAGLDLSVKVNHSVDVNGNGADSDGTVVSYEWTVNNVTLANTASFTYTPTTVGSKILVLKVTDDDGASDESNITVTVVPNEAPVVDAGTNLTVEQGSVLHITGTASDADGSISTYSWKEGGVEIATTLSFDYNPSSIGIKTLTLSVTDDDGATTSDTMEVNVTAAPAGNLKPIADAGTNLSVQVNTTVNITGLGSDDDGTISTYSWKKGSTVLATTASFDYTPTVVGIDTLTLTVTDNDGATDTDTLDINVTSTPVADITAPVITMAGQESVVVLLNSTYTDAGATAIDNVDGSVIVTVDNRVDTTKEDLYPVFYRAVDQAGNQAEAIRTVSVVKNLNFYALGDKQIISDTATPARVDVLANDHYSSAVSISFPYYYNDETGSWNIESNNEVLFTPAATFGGGKVLKSYKISDTNNNQAQALITLVYPEVLVAKSDEINASIGVKTVDVLANDIKSGAIEVSFFGGSKAYTDNDGTWSVAANNTIEFSPSSQFGGGTVSAWYTIRDTSGRLSYASVSINYDKEFYAEDDAFEHQNGNLEAVTVDVLSNDVLDTPVAVIGFEQNYNSNTLVSSKTVSSGTWNAESNKTLTFTPNATFGGGYVSYNYIIEDSNGRRSQADVSIAYSELLNAKDDEAATSDITASIDVDVTANDVHSSAITSVLVQDGWDASGHPTYGTQVTNNLGTVSVNSNTLHFEPDALFNGGDFSIRYQVTDADGHKSTAHATVTYPVVLQANDVQAGNATTPITSMVVDVTKNDTITGTLDTINVGHSWDKFSENYETDDGNWSVVSGKVEFTPNSTFGGGYTYVDYTITDTDGRTSEAQVMIFYEEVLVANWDDVTTTSTQAVTIDVMQNDIITNGPVQVTFSDGSTLMTDYQNNNWSVEANGSITVVPSASFLGGNLYQRYVLTDANNLQSETSFRVTFPVILKAEDDYADATSMTSVNVPVLDNDITFNGFGSLTINGSDSYSDWQGNTWNVESNNTITFIPNPNFGGGSVSSSYDLTDANGLKTKGWINIDYPEEFVLHYDANTRDDFSSITIDVLANDTISSGVKSMSLDSTVMPEGNWTLESDNSVTFVPSSAFGGGTAYNFYNITDNMNRSASGYVYVDYPVVLEAVSDEVTAGGSVIDIEVLANDIYTNTPVTVTINGSDFYQAYDGNWSVDNSNIVHFSPNDGVNSTFTPYVIVDSTGKTSQSYIYLTIQ